MLAVSDKQTSAARIGFISLSLGCFCVGVLAGSSLGKLEKHDNDSISPDKSSAGSGC
jgi:hypothetical protein